MLEVDQEALAVIKAGSKSFSLAAVFFSYEQRILAAQVYSWCRHCDDVIDEKDGDLIQLELLRSQTYEVWNHGVANLNKPFKGLSAVVNKTQISPYYFQELLNGMEMDLKGVLYQTIDELKHYCYRVASTVGLIMCHVMGIYSTSALNKAAQLGMAMQLTNISRDIKSDFEMGRLYLPVNSLKKVGLTSENYFDKENREKLFQVVKDVIRESEKLYKAGLSGIEHLPLRSALTVLIAGKIYRQIGREILKKGSASLSSRTVVSLYTKIILILTCFWSILWQLPKRILNPKKVVMITETWKYS